MKHLHKHFHSPALGLFIIRLVAGVIFMFHGIGKLSSMEGTIAFFASLGFGAILAWIVAIIETLGGLALILGYFSKFFSALLAVIMLVAIFKVKWSLGFTALEIDLMLLATVIAVLFSGCGRYSVCAWRHKDMCASCDKDCGCHPHA
jgi:uncharacterized membrane protein YphA (DoxX/SURF4 family)